MQREKRLILSCAAVGAVILARVLFLPSTPAAMPLGGPDPSLLDAVDDDGPITTLTEIPPAMRHRLTTVGRDLRREFKCLALNIFWESKGEPVVGQVAVASVTLNRLASPRFPKTICEVIWQGVENGRRDCQFSWACDSRGDRPEEPVAWQRAQQIAFRAMFLDPFDPTDGALYFHANYVHPNWVDEKERILRIGRHIFYREASPAGSVVRIADRY
jgi:Cell wall hydrolyses involved in spore germination